MTTSNFSDIIERYDLYRRDRDIVPMGALVERLRDAYRFRMINAQATDPRRRSANNSAIAFAVSFDYSEPRVTQQVVNELVTLYLTENLRARRAQAAETTDFLSREAARLQTRLRESETQLAAFKQENSGSLPDQMVVNMQAMNRAEQSLLDARQQIRALQERQILLEGQKAQLSPTLAPDEIAPTSESARRLAELQAEYARLSGVYSERHPDLRRLKREIEGLERDEGVVPDRSVLETETEKVRADLAALRERFSEEHPEVVRLSAQLASLEQALAVLPAGAVAGYAYDAANPAYVQVQTQIEAAKAELGSLRQLEATLRDKLRMLENAVLNGPEVERKYIELQRDYQNAQTSYQEVVEKMRTAELSEALESESKSERLVLIEPASLPDVPIWPPRLLMAAASLILSVFAGFAMVWLLEVTDSTLHGANQIYALIGEMPLVAVPTLRTAGDIVAGRVRIALGFGAAALVAVILAVAVQRYVMPLDIAWAALQQRFSMIFTFTS